MNKEIINKIICFFLLHEWESIFRNWYKEKNKPIEQYKIVCKRCGKGNEKEWKDNKTYIITLKD